MNPYPLHVPVDPDTRLLLRRDSRAAHKDLVSARNRPDAREQILRDGTFSYPHRVMMRRPYKKDEDPTGEPTVVEILNRHTSVIELRTAGEVANLLNAADAALTLAHNHEDRDVYMEHLRSLVERIYAAADDSVRHMGPYWESQLIVAVY